MADRSADGPGPATPPTAHAGHDLLLVASFAADDVEAAERTAAEALLASCPECTALAEDLRAISRATVELPAAVRRRDFTLRPEDAARLRPLGWRRLAAALGARRLEVSRPLAAGLMTLGLAGLLISGLPLLSLGSSAGAAPSAASAAAAAAAPSDADSYRSGAVQVAASPGVQASPGGTSAAVLTPVGGPSASGDTAGPIPTMTAASPDREAAPRLALDAGDGADPPVLLLASLVTLAAGLGLFVLSAAARSGR